MYLETEQEEGYPATVKILKENSSLVVHISLKATWGTVASPNLCGFYGEFGKNVIQASARTQTRQPLLPSQRLHEGVNESSLPPPSPPSPLPSSPSPAVILKTSLLPLSRGKVIWVYVNIREGPGIRHKIIGKAHMKNTFEILGENNDWLRVRLENGTVGWMSKKAVSESPVEPSPQGPPDSSRDSSRPKLSSKPVCPM